MRGVESSLSKSAQDVPRGQIISVAGSALVDSDFAEFRDLGFGGEGGGGDLGGR